MPPSSGVTSAVFRSLLGVIGLALVACGSSTTDAELDDSDEGNLFGWGSKQSDVLVARTVVADGVLTAAVARGGKLVAASKRDPELGGGLVSFAGGELDKNQFGVVCTTRENVCVVRWLTRDREVGQIAFRGEVGKKLAAAFRDGVEGNASAVACANGACTVTVAGLEEKNVEFAATKVDLDDLRAFAGL